jgi:hypothetical protein
MKNIIFVSGLCLLLSGPASAEAEIKEVCHDKVDKAGKPVLDKDGKAKQHDVHKLVALAFCHNPDEYEVVGFDQGSKGRDKGAIIWVCKNSDGESFNVTPKNITYEERYKLFKEAKQNNGKGFDEKFKGRMMTVEYEDLSADNIPLRAKAVGFREHI